jgi:hypothetical protein
VLRGGEGLRILWGTAGACCTQLQTAVHQPRRCCAMCDRHECASGANSQILTAHSCGAPVRQPVAGRQHVQACAAAGARGVGARRSSACVQRFGALRPSDAPERTRRCVCARALVRRAAFGAPLPHVLTLRVSRRSRGRVPGVLLPTSRTCEAHRTAPRRAAPQQQLRAGSRARRQCAGRTRRLTPAGRACASASARWACWRHRRRHWMLCVPQGCHPSPHRRKQRCGGERLAPWLHRRVRRERWWRMPMPQAAGCVRRQRRWRAVRGCTPACCVWRETAWQRHTRC